MSSSDRGASPTRTGDTSSYSPSAPPGPPPPSAPGTGELVPPSSIWTPTAGTTAPASSTAAIPEPSRFDFPATFRVTIDGLRKLAAALIPPANAGPEVYVTIEAGAYRAAWLVNGRTLVAFGPTFERGRDAYRLVDLIGGKTR